MYTVQYTGDKSRVTLQICCKKYAPIATTPLPPFFKESELSLAADTIVVLMVPSMSATT